MRILILSQYYQPEPVPKSTELAAALTEYGHEVSVITGYPNYPSGDLYPGYKLHLVKREVIDGIIVRRTYEYPYHGKRALGRIANYFSFMLSAPIGALFAPKCDVMYVWHPPLTVGVAAWIIARWRRIPFVYDVQDIWPDSVVLSGIMQPGPAVTFLAWLEKFVYKRADHVLVVTKGARQNLIGKGVSPDRVTVMPHWIDEELFRSAGEEERARMRREHGWEDRFVVLFAGNIGIVQGLESVVRAAEILGPESKVLMVLVGNGVDKARLQALVESLGLQEKVQFVGHQPIERIPSYTAAADALLVQLKKSPVMELVIPTKTVAYLAAGRPILAAVDGAAAELVEESGAGVFVEPEDPVALARTITKFIALPQAELDAMGQKGRQYLVANLAKQKVIKLYEGILKRVIFERTRSTSRS